MPSTRYPRQRPAPGALADSQPDVYVCRLICMRRVTLTLHQRPARAGTALLWRSHQRIHHLYIQYHQHQYHLEGSCELQLNHHFCWPGSCGERKILECRPELPFQSDETIPLQNCHCCSSAPPWVHLTPDERLACQKKDCTEPVFTVLSCIPLCFSPDSSVAIKSFIFSIQPIFLFSFGQISLQLMCSCHISYLPSPVNKFVASHAVALFRAVPATLCSHLLWLPGGGGTIRWLRAPGPTEDLRGVSLSAGLPNRLPAFSLRPPAVPGCAWGLHCPCSTPSG